MTALQGLLAAPHTPVDARGELALERIPELAAHLRACGVRGVFVNGTTGEGLCLSVEQRKRVAEAWADASGELFCILNLGAQALADSVELARHAQPLALDAVAMVAPSFHRPRSAADLVEFVAAAAAPAEKPVWLYHIPALTGVHLDAVEVCEGLLGRCERFAGVKYTVNDLLGLQAMLTSATGRWQVAWGCDELMLPALAMGAELFVGSTYNYAAPAYLRLIEAFERGDLAAAREESRRIPPLLEVLGRFGPIHAGKRLVGRWGIDLGGALPPERPLSSAELARLDEAIAALELMADADGAR